MGLVQLPLWPKRKKKEKKIVRVLVLEGGLATPVAHGGGRQWLKNNNIRGFGIQPPPRAPGVANGQNEKKKKNIGEFWFLGVAKPSP
jgi:hypothetical protein